MPHQEKFVEEKRNKMDDTIGFILSSMISLICFYFGSFEQSYNERINVYSQKHCEGMCGTMKAKVLNEKCFCPTENGFKEKEWFKNRDGQNK